MNNITFPSSMPHSQVRRILALDLALKSLSIRVPSEFGLFPSEELVLSTAKAFSKFIATPESGPHAPKD